jgi:hypothetical protein
MIQRGFRALYELKTVQVVVLHGVRHAQRRQAVYRALN